MKKLIYIVIAIFAYTGSAFAVDFSNLPHVSTKTIARIAKDYKSSGGKCRKTYTLAVSAKGRWASVCHSKAGKADLRRMTLEKCQHTAQAYCGVVFQSGKFVAFQETNSGLSYPTVFDAARVPFIRAANRKKLAGKYARAKGHRALAITRNGTYGTAREEDSAEIARTRAMQKCEGSDKNRGRCFIYSVDSKVVFNKRTSIYPR